MVFHCTVLILSNTVACVIITFFFCIKGVDFFSRAIMLNDKVVSLQLWDTAGQERYNHTHIIIN